MFGEGMIFFSSVGRTGMILIFYYNMNNQEGYYNYNNSNIDNSVHKLKRSSN